MNPDYKALFLEESQSQIKQWEDALLVLEKSPEDQDTLQELLRAIHTLKGSAGFVGCEELRNLAHRLESIMVQQKGEDAQLLPGVIDLLFEGLDAVRRIIDAFAQDQQVEGVAKALLDRLDERLGTAVPPGAPEPSGRRGPLYRINIHIEAPAAERYLRALLVQTRLEEIGTIVAVNPTLEELRLQDAEFEYGVVVETDRPRRRWKPPSTSIRSTSSGSSRAGPPPAHRRSAARRNARTRLPPKPAAPPLRKRRTWSACRPPSWMPCSTSWASWWCRTPGSCPWRATCAARSGTRRWWAVWRRRPRC